MRMKERWTAKLNKYDWVHLEERKKEKEYFKKEKGEKQWIIGKIENKNISF